MADEARSPSAPDRRLLVQGPYVRVRSARCGPEEATHWGTARPAVVQSKPGSSWEGFVLSALAMRSVVRYVGACIPRSKRLTWL